MIKKLLILSSIVIIGLTIGTYYFSIDNDTPIPEGAFEKKGIVTRLSPNCGKSQTLVDDEVRSSNEPILCDGGSFIQVDDLLIQYETGLSIDGFSYDIKNINIGDSVQAIYVLNSSNMPIINCDGCGVFK